VLAAGGLDCCLRNSWVKSPRRWDDACVRPSSNIIQNISRGVCARNTNYADPAIRIPEQTQRWKRRRAHILYLLYSESLFFHVCCERFVSVVGRSYFYFIRAVGLAASSVSPYKTQLVCIYFYQRGRALGSGCFASARRQKCEAQCDNKDEEIASRKWTRTTAVGVREAYSSFATSCWRESPAGKLKT